MHLDFLKAAYTSLLNSPNCVGGSRLLGYFCIIVIAHLGANVLCGFFSNKTRSDSIKAGFANFSNFSDLFTVLNF